MGYAVYTKKEKTGGVSPSKKEPDTRTKSENNIYIPSRSAIIVLYLKGEPMGMPTARLTSTKSASEASTAAVELCKERGEVCL
jgi:hypothetical protein